MTEEQRRAFLGLQEFLALVPQHGGRLTDRVEFAFDLPEADEAGGGLEGGAGAHADSLVAKADLAEEGLQFSGDLTSTGRGAEALGFVLQVIGVGWLVSQIAGAVNDWADFAARVGRVWKKLRRHESKRPPMLSLGALKLLSAADLIERGVSLDGLYLVFAGDVGGGQAADLSYTGQDLFLILFANPQHGGWYLYLVDALGGIIHYAEGPGHKSLYGESPLGVWDYEANERLGAPPFLLESGAQSVDVGDQAEQTREGLPDHP